MKKYILFTALALVLASPSFPVHAKDNSAKKEAVKEKVAEHRQEMRAKKAEHKEAIRAHRQEKRAKMESRRAAHKEHKQARKAAAGAHLNN